ncbi:MAG: 30S ribosomal protein S15 [Sediminibacterium sp.]|nr:30S ribosomal protein S15 [Sediminibacterium sp.]
MQEKKQIIINYGKNEADSGNVEVQIALLTDRISHISNHLKTHKKDFSTQNGLMKLVGQRKSYLNYLHKHQIEKYRSLIEKLNLRK